MKRYPWPLLVLIYSVLIGAAGIVLYPVLRVVSTSVRPFDKILTTGLGLIPQDATLDNYKRIFTSEPFLLWISNSLLVTGVTAYLSVSIAAISAYALTRWRFPMRRLILLSIFFVQLIPGSVMLVPTYLMVMKLNLVNTYAGLLLSYAVGTVPFSIWLLRGYFSGIDVSAEEAAMIDGAGPIRIFYSILLPQAMPVIGVVFILSVMAGWSEYILARMVLVDQTLYTWPLGLNRFSSQYQTLWGVYSASSVVISIPAVLVFLWVAPQLHRGLSSGLKS
ncbi:sugar ABC transporter permease [Spirochaeta lutea]|uniref:sugar ABC transporter permease n=1 Tax=Spirochaeta lutea TaxID=1480694 RepID=UPI00068ECC62|nr:ABC transporter permease subunit [Spirochaeta lutea]